MKEKLGAGFTLELYLKSEVESERVNSYVKSLFPNANLNEHFGNFLSFRVPRRDVKSLSLVFASIEAGKIEFSLFSNIFFN